MPCWLGEISRRLLALALMLAAIVLGPAQGHWLAAGLASVAGVLVYSLIPRPSVPAGAVHANRLAAVVVPDLLGFLLALVFLGLPPVAAAHDASLPSPWGLYVVTGLPGLLGVAILGIAARQPCRWILLEADALMVSTPAGVLRLPLAEITSVRVRSRQMPGWLAWLFVASAPVHGAAAGMASGDRANHRLVIERQDGHPVRLPANALRSLRPLLTTLADRGVPVQPGLA